MLRHCLGVFMLVWVFAGCGEDPTSSVIWEVPIVDGTFLMDAGAYTNFDFSVDLAQMNAPALVGAFRAAVNSGDAGTIQVLVLGNDDFELWKNAETYAVIFESELAPGASFEIPIPETGAFQLIFSNLADSLDQKAVDAIVSLVFEEIPAM